MLGEIGRPIPDLQDGVFEDLLSPFRLLFCQTVTL